MNPLFVREHIRRFLEEDIGRGDVTTEALRPSGSVRALVVAKEEGILAGSPFAAEVFSLLGGVKVKTLKGEGERFQRGEALLELEGEAQSILTGERVALNLLQSLSGIATRTRKFVEALEGTGVRLLDTRKTTPGYRYFQKYAVRVGGGLNHRFALYDMVLIKDNHKRIMGGLREAVRAVKERVGPAYRIEVEVGNLEEVEEALEEGVDLIMLDNFSPEEVKSAVELIGGRAQVEVSGNITLENLRDYAVRGVDFVSSGSVIYRASWIDLSLRVL